MADIAAIAGILGSVKTAVEITKLIKDSSDSLEQAEVKLKLAELIGALADVKMEAAEIQTHLIARDERIRELEQKLKTKDDVVYEAPYYWLINGDDKDGPFCQKCHDVDSKLIRLQNIETGSWHCKVCNNVYRDRSYTSRSIGLL
ncbi:hypothetical protein [Kiloniella litopenaei]|uniref:hypothetical protein n=1 Tax=Kiloniella litopenaei TaxID=1549748 RepID=UPI003BAD0EAA